MKYEQTWEGEWFRPKQRGYRMGCCDCGLVHVVNFRVRDGKVEMQVYRHARATAAKRRKRKAA